MMATTLTLTQTDGGTSQQFLELERAVGTGSVGGNPSDYQVQRDMRVLMDRKIGPDSL